jgi:hypothetical protein
MEIHIEGWDWVKKAALKTIGKKHIEGKQISSEWKKKILISMHSPIRELSIRIDFGNIERWVADQLVRHNVGCNNFMRTGRPDRGNIPRCEQTLDMLTELIQSHNAESFINMTSKRLCVGCVSKKTRGIMESIVKEVGEVEPELALMCVPPCIKSLGCKEVFTECSFFENFMNYMASETDIKIRDLTNIEERYKAYREYRSLI